MVWFAITFVTLTAFAGLALEYNRWQQIATRAQKAADAASLAGAVFMPENSGNKAFNTAQNISTLNGFKNGTNGVTVTAAVGMLPNQLKVTVAINTKNPWGAMVGYNSTTIVRSAVAEYQLPQNLGSPQNIYGNDPELANQSGQPQLWGNVFGPASPKGNGDAILSVGPSASSTNCPTTTDNCNGPALAPVANVNRDYDANGYFYGIDVPANPTGALNVQVFDPAFVHVGDTCGAKDSNGNFTDSPAYSELTNAATLSAGSILGYPSGDAPSVRYAPGLTKYCNGDISYSGTTNPWTVWTLRSPDISTWDPTNNPIVCQAEFPGIYPEQTNDQPNGPSDSPGFTHLSNLLKSNANYAGVSPAMKFSQFFRQWVNLCSVTSPVQGTYFLQIQTVKKIDGTATPVGGGANRFSIRAGLGSNYATNNGLHVYGNQKMGAYANATGANTQFYLTRVLPGEAGKTLVLNFFDTGDAGSPGDLSILPPADSNVTGGIFANCVYTAPPGNATGPPWGTFAATSSGCKITGVSSGGGYNGQWVTWKIPIPNNYTCDTVNATGCWAKLKFAYPAGTSVNDTTTWAAYILGEPVRLIQ